MASAISGQVHASMGNLATTFGILPSDMATAQAYSLFNDQVSAAYYNPAALALSPRGELTIGAMQASPELIVESKGGANPPTRSGKVLESTNTENVLVGMKTNLTSLTKFETPVYLGLIAGVEKYGMEMLAFDSSTELQGQFFQYGQKPLFLSIAGAAKVMDGINVGAGLRVTLHASATMELESDLAGNTNSEKLSVSAEPVLIPVAGITADMGELLCSEDEACFWQGLDFAFSYRGESDTQTKVNANATIPGTIPDPGLPLIVTTLDAYQPMILSFGTKYDLTSDWDVSGTIEFQQWSTLTDELKKDTIKDQANLEFKDSYIPRIGTRYKWSDLLTLNAGISYEESPLESTQSADVNVFDNDRLIGALGLTAYYRETKFLAYPLRIDAAYQYHQLQDREFTLSSDEVPVSPYEEVNTKGSAHVISLSFSMTF
ncbi:aromatic hydrocarbon degradation protein [Bermanella marisrubri]|uniref:Long-chain fatty acid transport protein n=1 Tax=Bermanella marisrubri TaxID=207949 RepID=Q1N5E4_9GAMM|nr:outer membrane protein transport protein [Bermanella marisrubri]EAT13175.1 long-chain fatty acid transport protein precursor [Oceanobacter sp. RED65] [Bermanella marisrubri]QIZ83946.1 aromatic hydrocarbon degradation protein [Bermanella marisrubri]